jgi:glycosyltransferase involved in cell wall biosynthesis
MSTRRVAHVVLQLDIGGMEKLLVEFAKHVDRERFELHFVCIGKRGPIADEIEGEGWPVVVLDEPPGINPRLVFRLAHLFRELSVDVVHTHNTKPMLYAAPAARLARVRRVVHTRHGPRLGLPKTARAAFVYRTVSRCLDRFVCVSSHVARMTAQEGVARKRITTVLNGIDVRQFSYAGPVDDGPALAVGRISPEKDLGTMLEAVALVVKEYPRFRLEVAGDGACLPALRDRCSKLGLDGTVRFLGEVKDVAPLLARASLFVQSSLTEGISLTILEAMARGLPVVATRVGGNSEVVADGVTGYLIRSSSPSEVALAMIRLLRSPEERRRMGAAGRARVESVFDVRRMVREYEALYIQPHERRSMETSGQHNESAFS